MGRATGTIISKTPDGTAHEPCHRHSLGAWRDPGRLPDFRLILLGKPPPRLPALPRATSPRRHRLTTSACDTRRDGPPLPDATGTMAQILLNPD